MAGWLAGCRLAAGRLAGWLDGWLAGCGKARILNLRKKILGKKVSRKKSFWLAGVG
jgi:hypothetical protein